MKRFEVRNILWSESAWLADYADLLRKMKRDDEAAKLEARAAEIRAKAAPKMQN
jgi:hypothetical protein